MFLLLCLLYVSQIFVNGDYDITGQKRFLNGFIKTTTIPYQNKVQDTEQEKSTSTPIPPKVKPGPPVHSLPTPIITSKPPSSIPIPTPELTTQIPSPNPESPFLKDSECPPNKSLHSETDIKVMINYIYDELSINDHLKEVYEKQLESMRDIFMQDLAQFLTWFQNQPNHLKHVLEALGEVRKQNIEPKITKISKILSTSTDLETQFNKKSEKLDKLLKFFKRYKAMCIFNCADAEEHRISKREVVENNYYCSSLTELYEKINQKLSKSLMEMKNEIIDELSTQSTEYNKTIENLKHDLKNKALVAFGRTMYEVLILQDEYHHFVQDLNITQIETDIDLIENINLELDEKLLQLHRAVEKYGHYCRNCGDVFITSVRRINDEDIDNADSLNIVDHLIDSKFNETGVHIKHEWEEILDILNNMILDSQNDTAVETLMPIQEEVIQLTSAEREEMKRLKSIAPQATIRKILDLLNKSQQLLKIINDTIKEVESLVKK